jgi:hypothetical protein
MAQPAERTSADRAVTRRRAVVLAMTVCLVSVAVVVAWWSGHRRPAGPSDDPVAGGVALPALRDELLAMRRADQQERTGEGLPPGTKLPPTQDYTRSVRLRQIVAEHGWPTHRLVGEDGAEAAWLVAQHADFDVDFQERAVALLRPAVSAGQADPKDLAYLEDRVAVNRGRPQRYGTQVRCRDGAPAPATPLADPAAVDERRARIGLGPLEEYYRELAMMCADEAAEGAQPQP